MMMGKSGLDSRWRWETHGPIAIGSAGNCDIGRFGAGVRSFQILDNELCGSDSAAQFCFCRQLGLLGWAE